MSMIDPLQDIEPDTDGDDEPVYFYCMCCRHTQEHDDVECDRCGACCMEPVF
jgi:hypothetical protein